MAETPGPGEETVDPNVVKKAQEVNPTITPPGKIDVAALRKSLGNFARPAETPAAPAAKPATTPPAK